jgi:hypothetical protein
MNQNNHKVVQGRQIYAIFLALIAFSTVFAQFFLVYSSGKLSFFYWLLRFFTFFTIIGNSLLGIYALSEWRAKTNRGRVLDMPVLIYISVVGIVYHALLQDVWNPQGLQKITDLFLHTIIPLGTLIYWLCYKVRQQQFRWQMLIQWLVLPTIYFGYVLIFGYFCQAYPYPFLEVGELGYPKVLLTAVILAAGMLTIGLLYIALAKSLQYVLVRN